MSTITELREKAKLNREMKDRRVDRVRDALKHIADDPAFSVTLLAHPNKDAEDLAATIADHVVEVGFDATREFMDACKARGLQDSKIRYAVEIMNEAKHLTDSTSYNDKKTAVAEYMWEHQSEYDTIALFAKSKNTPGTKTLTDVNDNAGK